MWNQTQITARLGACLMALLLLCACGQKGGLVRPEAAGGMPPSSMSSP